MWRGGIRQGVIGGQRIVRHVHDTEQTAVHVAVCGAREPPHRGRDGPVAAAAMREPAMPVMSGGIAVNAHADAHPQPL